MQGHPVIHFLLYPATASILSWPFMTFRDNFPATAINYQRSIITNKCHAMITLIRTIIDTRRMFPQHIKTIEFKNRG